MHNLHIPPQPSLPGVNLNPPASLAEIQQTTHPLGAENLPSPMSELLRTGPTLPDEIQQTGHAAKHFKVNTSTFRRECQEFGLEPFEVIGDSHPPCPARASSPPSIGNSGTVVIKASLNGRFQRFELPLPVTLAVLKRNMAERFPLIAVANFRVVYVDRVGDTVSVFRDDELALYIYECTSFDLGDVTIQALPIP